MYEIQIFQNKNSKYPTIYNRKCIKEGLKLLNELPIENFYEIRITKKQNNNE